MQENIAKDHQNDSNKIKKVLLGSEKGWELTIDAIPDLIAILDTDHKVVKVNMAMAKKLDALPNDCIEKICYQAVHRTETPPENCPHSKLLNDGLEHTSEVYEENLGGYFIVTASPIKDYDGNLLGSIHIAHDISARKQAEDIAKSRTEKLNKKLEELRNTESLLSSISNLSSDVIYVKDSQSRWIFVNPALERIMGKKSDDLLGKTDLEIYPNPKIGKAILENDNRIMESGNEETLEEVVETTEGMRSFISVKTPRFNQNGRVIGIVGISHDITGRKKIEESLRESEERFRALADNIPNMAFMVDPNGWIFWYNKQWYEYTGTTLEEMQGWGWQKVHHPDYVDAVTEEWSTKILNETPYEDIHPLKGKDGNYRWFMTRITPIKNDQGKLVRWLGTNTDITNLKHYEESLQTTMEELRRSNKELEQFAYITSHDLREPLRMITSFLQLLEKRYKNQLDQDANEFIGFAVDGAKRLDAMTNDLLKYSQITNEKREIISINFEHVLEHALTNLKVQIEESNTIITYDPLPTIKGDEKLKIQLFQNLIGNAIKYRSQKTPKIHISATKEGNQYLLSIKDNGIGMSPEHLEKIFTIFKRLHTHEEYEGTGIGLAIVQKIVHQQGGKIWVESELGKGTTFYFTIPIN